MTLPIYRIMVYHGANLLHTIETDAKVVRVSESLTGEVGTFSFTLPSSKAPNDYSYNDIALFDTVKIWLGHIETNGFYHPVTTVEEVYVNSFDSAETDWIETGASPYLNDSDDNYIQCHYKTRCESKFTFPNSAGSGTIVSVKIRIEIKTDDANTAVLYAWDGSAWHSLGTVGGDLDYTWYELDVSDILTSWALINGTSLRFIEETQGAGYCFVRRATRKVTYTVLVANDPDTVGRIFHISSPVQTGQGYVRIYSGMNQGEVLQRNLDTKYWTDTHADVIVAELASDLSLGTSFSGDAADDYHVTLHEEDQKYWDILKDISDYWVSAGVQISKDFYVDITGNLVWKTRPLRSGASVETLTERNMKSFSVVKNLSQVFNTFYVYGELGKIGVVGAEGRCEPTDMDTWTYDGLAADKWVQVTGTVDADIDHEKVGSNCLECLSTDPAHEAEFYRLITVPMLGKEKYQSLNFYIRKEFGGTDNIDVRLYAPDSSNYFWTTVSMTSTHVFHQYELGQNNEYDVDKRPNGTWHKQGSPLWYYLPRILFKGTFVSQETIWLDSLYFGHGRFRATMHDDTSQTDYGVRELVVVDDALHSDAECTCRGNLLLSKMKDPSTQLEIVTAMNTNIKIGDRLVITLPSEAISAVNFDVLNAEHTFIAGSEGGLTKAVLNSNERQREKVPNSPIEVLKKLSNEVRNLVKAGEKLYAPI